MTIHPSHCRCIKSAVLTGLRQMYIDGSFPGLGIGIKISGLQVGPLVIDPNEGCCITRCKFLLTHIIPRARDELKRPTKKCFHLFSFDDTEEKVAVRFEGKKGQDAIYEITFFIIYQQNVIMSFVNTKITSKHCNAKIFFFHAHKGSFTILRIIIDLGCFS